MKRINTIAIIVHTTASSTRSTVAQIMDYFLKFLRWQKGGYHYIIDRKGKVSTMYDPRKMEATNGVLPSPCGRFSNLDSIHISYIGGISDVDANEARNNITKEQELALVQLLQELLKTYTWVKVLGHNQINLKYCPSFWVPDWLRAWGFEEKFILDYDPFNIKNLVKNLKNPYTPNFYQKRK
jgi:hypothetical protein